MIDCPEGARADRATIEKSLYRGTSTCPGVTLSPPFAAGASIVLTEGSVTEPGFWRTFEQTGCTSLAGVPNSFDLMDQARIRTDHLQALRYMTQAVSSFGAYTIPSIDGSADN